MTTTVSTVLRTAAKDVQRGLWCQGSWLLDPEVLYNDKEWYEGGDLEPSELLPILETDKTIITERDTWLRCAEGSILFATALLYGDEELYTKAVGAVDKRLGDFNDLSENCDCTNGSNLWAHNDTCLTGLDAKEAGESLAALFEAVAADYEKAEGWL